MHVLGSIGHSFSQRRKSSKCQRSGKPKDLHIHKVSFSGFSLSSECSMSSASTTSTTTSTACARSPVLRTPTSGQAFGPLGFHPTFQPPPRLHERPLISPELASASYPPSSAFDDESADEDEEFFCHGIDEDEYTVCSARAIRFTQATETMLPSFPGSPDSFVDDSELELEPEDYFMMKQMAKRPDMPRSRWSDSTIQTLDLDHLTPDSDDDEGPMTPDSDSHVGLSSPVPNFSYKRDTTGPRRPPMRSLDSLEDFIKQGGWKRRGVIFDAEGCETHSHKSSLF